MILHDITYDAKLIKVATTALSPKWLFECYLHIADVVVIPRGAKESVGKSQDQHVLHQLLSKVMINPAID